jgi:hypothetical protein
MVLLLVPVLGATSADGCTSSPAKDACGAAACPSTQVRVCGRNCVTPIAVGGTCSLDLCATNGTCASGSTCVPTGSGNNGTCTKRPTSEGSSASTLASECSLVTTANGVRFDECANDLICREMARCGDERSIINGVTARCATSVSEGQVCDSESATYDATIHCSPCGPGLACKTIVAGDQARCVRSCLVDSECPCTGGAGKCVTASDGSKVCGSCVSLREGCDGYNRCCDTGEQCGTSGTAGTCCRQVGAACVRGSDCCASASGNPVVCATTSGTSSCQVCKGNNVACSDKSECCAGGSCDNGVCRFSCNTKKGQPCNNVPNVEGACKLGVYDCTANGQQYCRQTVFPVADTECDGIDADCDGDPDHKEFPTKSFGPCSAPALGCGFGFQIGVPGADLCKKVGATGAALQCVTNDEAYCNAPGDESCGLEAQSPCTSSGAKCSINSSCINVGGPNWECVKIQGCVDPGCWPRNSVQRGNGLCYVAGGG